MEKKNSNISQLVQKGLKNYVVSVIPELSE